MNLLRFMGLSLTGGLIARAAVQETYNYNMGVAVAGFRADMTPATFLSRNVEDAAGIGFGKVVKKGATDKGITADLTGLDASNFQGVTIVERTTLPESPDVFAQYQSARLITKGAIYVMTDSAVVAGTDVTVTLATGGLGSAAVAAGVVAIPNAKWETSTSGAGLAVLRLG
jgi:hypothetical protein